MRLDRLRSIETHGISLDTETYLIAPGVPAPGLVCGSVGWLADNRVDGKLLAKSETLELFCQALDSPDVVISGANIAYDIIVLASELGKRGIDALPSIFATFEQDRIYDLQVAEALNAISDGMLGKDPRTGGELKNPETGRRGRYSLSICVDLTLGRTDAKAADEFRLRYGELDGIPIEQWPQTARDYPVDDAKNTLEVVLAQVGSLPKVGTRHRYTPRPGEEGNGGRACLDCGSPRFSDPCHTRRPHRNLHDVGAQTYTSFCLSLGAAWGFHVNQRSVDIIERHAIRDRDRGITPFIEAGLVRADGTEDRAAIKRRVAESYGASESCPHCNGAGKVQSARTKYLRCPDCRGRSVPWKSGGTLKAPTVTTCATCSSTGQILHPKQDMVTCYARVTPSVEIAAQIEALRAEGEAAASVLADLLSDNGLEVDGFGKAKSCDGTGLVLTDDVPRSDKEGVSYGGSSLQESGDDFLMSFGDYHDKQKHLSVYLPYLRGARVPIGFASDGTPTAWEDRVLNPRPSGIPLDTGRRSYDGAMMLFPRASGYLDKESGEYVPSLRECFEARPGRVLSSEDFHVGELIAHSQNCIWTVGHSDLAQALMQKIDPHSALAATTLGISYDEFMHRLKKLKDPTCKDARQAAKPITFGRPAAMGAVKIVLAQRAQGPDTPCPLGPSMLDDGKGGEIPGYRGLRYCVLAGAERCGIRKVTLWGKRGREKKIPPTCVACLEAAQRICDVWLRQWSENSLYFDFINGVVDRGMVIMPEAIERWPAFREQFEPWQQLAPGEVAQHVTARVRGGLEYSAACNGLFQSLIADSALAAYRRVVRECYDRTIRVPEFAHTNSKRSEFANLESPLLGSHPVMFLHDEILVEHDLGVAHEGATRVSEIMEEELRWYCPDVAPAVKAEPTLMTRWLKGAECVRDANGRLVPWEPSA